MLFERIGEPCERSLVTERPMPPVPLVSHMTSRDALGDVLDVVLHLHDEAVGELRVERCRR